VTQSGSAPGIEVVIVKLIVTMLRVTELYVPVLLMVTWPEFQFSSIELLVALLMLGGFVQSPALRIMKIDKETLLPPESIPLLLDTLPKAAVSLTDVTTIEIGKLHETNAPVPLTL
jgi:hypothetical protein